MTSEANFTIGNWYKQESGSYGLSSVFEQNGIIQGRALLCYIKIHRSILHFNRIFFLFFFFTMPDFITLRSGHLEDIGSLSDAHLPNVLGKAPPCLREGCE